jgi:hypothetical protein
LFKQHVDEGMNLHPDLRRAVSDKSFFCLFYLFLFLIDIYDMCRCG